MPLGRISVDKSELRGCEDKPMRLRKRQHRQAGKDFATPFNDRPP
jgi:hypothetical protein